MSLAEVFDEADFYYSGQDIKVLNAFKVNVDVMVLGVLHYRKQIQTKSQPFDTSIKSIITDKKCALIVQPNNIILKRRIFFNDTSPNM